MPLTTIAALASGSTVRAARSEKTAATPAGIAVGTTTTGHHMTLLPKLAPSWEKKISPAVTAAPAAVRAERVRSKRPVRTSRTAVESRLISVAVLGAGQVLLDLLLDALPDEACGVLVAVQHRRRRRLHLLPGGVRRDRRDVGGAADVEHGRPVGGQRRVPRGADVVGLLHVDALQAERAGEGGVVDVGQGLRLGELRRALHGAHLPGHLVEVVVVQDGDHQPRVGPLRAVLGGGDELR